MGKLLLVVILLAVLVYGVLRLLEKRGLPDRRRPRPSSPPQRRSVAPDDDEDFLRDLNRKRRTNDDGPDPAG